MAGYQPTIRGYFNEYPRHLRKLFDPLLREIDEIDPTLFVLLPAGIFNLCPHESLPRDIALMDELMTVVKRDAGGLIGRPAEMNRQIVKTVDDWLASCRHALSEYMMGRFAPRPGIISSMPGASDGRFVLLDSFNALTVQQASMTMGALVALTRR